MRQAKNNECAKCKHMTLENSVFCMKCTSEKEELIKTWIERSKKLSGG